MDVTVGEQHRPDKPDAIAKGAPRKRSLSRENGGIRLFSPPFLLSFPLRVFISPSYGKSDGEKHGKCVLSLLYLLSCYVVVVVVVGSSEESKLNNETVVTFFRNRFPSGSFLFVGSSGLLQPFIKAE